MNEFPTDSGAGASGAASDIIEFQCEQCRKQLRVSLSDAGRRIKCPSCAAVMRIPESQIPPAESQLASEVAGGNSSDGGAPLTSPAPQAPLMAPPSPEQSPAPPAYASPPATTPDNTGGELFVSPAAAHTQQPFDSGVPAPFSSPSSESLSNREPSAEVQEIRAQFDRIIAEIRKIYVGQDELVLGTLVALFSGGHVLIESVPGLGKTLFVRALGQVLGCEFGRIQFTADLMPSDITGAPIFDMKNQEFRFRPGPVFTQLLLADEINRSPAKTHAALLEIMQEYRVTIDGTSHVIGRPFLVLATQNPIESEGTYNLPEAQLDRFMFKIVANYPGEAEEANILHMHSKQVDLSKRLAEELQTICSPEEILSVTQKCNDIVVDDRLIDYINKLVRLTREWPQFHIGASPRAGIALLMGARTLAAFRGRDYAVPDDVIEIALQALRHRVSLTAEAEVEGHRVDDLLRDLIRSVEVPRL